MKTNAFENFSSPRHDPDDKVRRHETEEAAVPAVRHVVTHEEIPVLPDGVVLGVTVGDYPPPQ